MIATKVQCPREIYLCVNVDFVQNYHRHLIDFRSKTTMSTEINK